MKVETKHFVYAFIGSWVFAFLVILPDLIKTQLM